MLFITKTHTIGFGTLANEAIAAQLSLSLTPGLILSNGEFGQRLIDHAKRWGLRFDVLKADYKAAFEKEDVEQALHKGPLVSWLWATVPERCSSRY